MSEGSRRPRARWTQKKQAREVDIINHNCADHRQARGAKTHQGGAWLRSMKRAKRDSSTLGGRAGAAIAELETKPGMAVGQARRDHRRATTISSAGWRRQSSTAYSDQLFRLGPEELCKSKRWVIHVTRNDDGPSAA